jgi:hypothetical protein
MDKSMTWHVLDLAVKAWMRECATGRIGYRSMDARMQGNERKYHYLLWLEL